MLAPELLAIEPMISEPFPENLFGGGGTTAEIPGGIEPPESPRWASPILFLHGVFSNPVRLGVLAQRYCSPSPPQWGGGGGGAYLAGTIEQSTTQAPSS